MVSLGEGGGRHIVGSRCWRRWHSFPTLRRSVTNVDGLDAQVPQPVAPGQAQPAVQQFVSMTVAVGFPRAGVRRRQPIGRGRLNSGGVRLAASIMKCSCTRRPRLMPAALGVVGVQAEARWLSNPSRLPVHRGCVARRGCVRCRNVETGTPRKAAPLCCNCGPVLDVSALEFCRGHSGRMWSLHSSQGFAFTASNSPALMRADQRLALGMRRTLCSQRRSVCGERAALSPDFAPSNSGARVFSAGRQDVGESSLRASCSSSGFRRREYWAVAFQSLGVLRPALIAIGFGLRVEAEISAATVIVEMALHIA